MTMDKLFDGSDAHLLLGNAELIQRLNEPELYYPGNFDTPSRANALLSGLCQEAADALEAADKRIAELEGFIDSIQADLVHQGESLEKAYKRIAELEAAMVGWRADQKENIATAVEECKRANEAERKLTVARGALTNIYKQTQEGATHALATEALIAIRQEALAQIGGDDASQG